MTIQYIGKTTYFEGKRLFDILCRLKNFGVGRIVVRNHYLKQYSEPTYYIITRVEPDMSDPTQVITLICYFLWMLMLQDLQEVSDTVKTSGH